MEPFITSLHTNQWEHLRIAIVLIRNEICLLFCEKLMETQLFRVKVYRMVVFTPTRRNTTVINSNQKQKKKALNNINFALGKNKVLTQRKEVFDKKEKKVFI